MMRRYVIIATLFLIGGIAQAVTAEEAQELAKKMDDIISGPSRPSRPQEIEELIEQGADIHAPQLGFSALWLIIAQQDPEIFEILLEHGFHVQKVMFLIMYHRMMIPHDTSSEDIDWEIVRNDCALFILISEYGYSCKEIIERIKTYPRAFMKEFDDLLVSILLGSSQKEIQTLLDKENNEKAIMNALRLAAGQGRVDIVKLLLSRLQRLTTQGSIIDLEEYENALLKIFEALNVIINRKWSEEDKEFATASQDIYLQIRDILGSSMADYYAWLWHNSLRALTINGMLPEELAVQIVRQNHPKFPPAIIDEIIHQFYNQDRSLYEARAHATAQLIEELFNLAQQDIDGFRAVFQAQSSHLSAQSLETLRSRLEHVLSTSVPSSPAVQRLDLVLPLIYDELHRRSIAEPIRNSLDEQLEQAVKDGDLSDVRDLLKKLKKISPALLELANRELAEESNPRLQRISPELIEARRDILRLIQERLAPSVSRPHRIQLSGESG